MNPLPDLMSDIPAAHWRAELSSERDQFVVNVDTGARLKITARSPHPRHIWTARRAAESLAAQLTHPRCD